MVSLNFGKMSVFNESGKISKLQFNVISRGPSHQRLYSPIDLPQNLTLACSSRCSKFEIDLRVVSVLTLREDEIRADARADTNRWMMADLFSDELPASILANALVGFTE